MRKFTARRSPFSLGHSKGLCKSRKVEKCSDDSMILCSKRSRKSTCMERPGDLVLVFAFALSPFWFFFNNLVFYWFSMNTITWQILAEPIATQLINEDISNTIICSPVIVATATLVQLCNFTPALRGHIFAIDKKLGRDWEATNVSVPST